MRLACFKCGRGLEFGPLHRQNEKGVAAILACDEHNEKAIDPEVAEIVAIIESDKKVKQ